MSNDRIWSNKANSEGSAIPIIVGFWVIFCLLTILAAYLSPGGAWGVIWYIIPGLCGIVALALTIGLIFSRTVTITANGDLSLLTCSISRIYGTKTFAIKTANIHRIVLWIKIFRQSIQPYAYHYFTIMSKDGSEILTLHPSDINQLDSFIEFLCQVSGARVHLRSRDQRDGVKERIPEKSTLELYNKFGAD